MSEALSILGTVEKLESTWEIVPKNSFCANRTSEGVHVSSVVGCDGIQVNAAAALSLQMIALLT